MVWHSFYCITMRNKNFRAILVKSGNGGPILRLFHIRHRYYFIYMSQKCDQGYSAHYKLSFEVLHDHICQYIDFTPFWGVPFLRGQEKWVRGSKKLTP